MNKALLTSLVIGSGLLLAACSSKQTAVTAPSPQPATVMASAAPESMEVTETTIMTEDTVAPATKTDSVDDLDKEISSYTIQEEQFN